MPKLMTKQFRIEGTAAILEIKATEWSRSEAMKKGLKIGSMVFLGAIASILVPLVHFISVPVGLLAAPIISTIIYKSYVGQLEVTTGNVICPKCQEGISLEKMTFLDHLQVECKKCKHEILLDML